MGGIERDEGGAAGAELAMAVRDLERFLVSLGGDNVLSPVELGKKHPIFPHKDGSWTWRQWRSWRSRPHWRQSDVCVLLDTVCVLDVDDKGVCDELEKAFPVLLEAPAVDTARGRHYWFTRSSVADELEYYDCKTVTKSVDFKTRTRSARSVLMVPPSKGKKWLRKPWSTGSTIFEIPFDVLTRVVGVRERALPAVVSCCSNGTTVSVTTKKCLQKCGYFEPYFTGDFEGVMPIPVSCDSILSLVAMVDERRWIREPDLEHVREMFFAAEILNIEHKLWMSVWSHTYFRGDYYLYGFDKCRYRSVVALRDAVLRGREYELCDIGSRTVCYIGRNSMRYANDEVLLYPLQTEDARVGEHLWIGRADVVVYTPYRLRAFMQKYSDHMIVAGGYVVGLFSNVSSGSDIDVFLHGCGEDVANEILNDFVLSPDMDMIQDTPKAATFRCGERTVQIIKRLHSTPLQVLATFDLAPCRCLIRYDSRSREYVMEGTRCFLRCVETMTFHVEFDRWSESTCARVFKYIAKGFMCVIPGLERGSTRLPLAHKWLNDAWSILRTETIILKRRNVIPRTYEYRVFPFMNTNLRVDTSRLTTFEAFTVNPRQADYGELESLRLFYLPTWRVISIMKRFFKRREEDRRAAEWSSCPERQMKASFKPCDARDWQILKLM